MTQYDDALDAQAAIGILKRDLPVAYVLAYAQLRPQQSGARVRAVCPFHEDHDPSLEVWLEADGTQRWGCWPCGKRGDVIDLIRGLWGLGFGDGVAAGRVLLAEAANWSGPTPEQGSSWDVKGASQMVMDAFKHFDSQAVAGLIEAKGWQFTPYRLRDLLCGTAHGRLVVPYFGRNAEVVAVKHRALDGSGTMWAMPGSQLRETLYLEYADPFLNDRLPVLICEGESDVWTALAAENLHPRGLPSGAGSPPYPFVERLAGRRVYLAFDGDEAGDQGAGRWAAALVGSDVIRIEIPRGYDITSLGSVEWLKTLT